MPDEPTSMERRQARSGRVSFSKPVVIRGGSGKSRFEVVPQYIPHDSGPDTVAVKLNYWKMTAGTLGVGYPASITLDEEEVRRLRDVLDQALVVAGAGREGNYLLIPLTGEAAATEGRDPADLGRAAAALIANTDVLAALTEDQDSLRRLAGLRGVLRIADLVDALHELEASLDAHVNAEDTYQQWCERHCWAFGNAYAMRDDVRNIALGDSVDHLMSLTANGLRDIFELKRPDDQVLHWDRDHKCWYWSAAVSKAIGQCHRYLDALHEAAARGLRDHPEVIAYHPRATIVIGRSLDWKEDQLRGLHGLNARLHLIHIMTYDQLIAQGRRLLMIIEAEN